MAKRKYRHYPKGAGWLPVAPRALPSMQLMLDDIGARPEVVAEHLGVDVTTVYRWLRGSRYPLRSTQLALFYETKWGRNFVHTAAHNDALIYGRAMVWLEGEVARLRQLLERVGSIGGFGSANDPSPDIPLPTRRQLQTALLQVPQAVRSLPAPGRRPSGGDPRSGEVSALDERRAPPASARNAA